MIVWQVLQWRCRSSQTRPDRRQACCHPPPAWASPQLRPPQSAELQKQAIEATWQMESLDGAPSPRSSWRHLGEPFKPAVCISCKSVLGFYGKAALLSHVLPPMCTLANYQSLLSKQHLTTVSNGFRGCLPLCNTVKCNVAYLMPPEMLSLLHPSPFLTKGSYHLK